MTKTTRDHRIDALRGLALIMMYVDHIPEDLLNRFTMRNVGFADAAEIFVLLAGYASWLAYGKKVNQEGLWKVYKRVIYRSWKIYLYQMSLIFVSLFCIYQWRRLYNIPVDFLEPELSHGYGILRALWRLIIMNALPSNLNILPLYIVLLLSLPLIIILGRLYYALPLLISFIIWLIVNIDPGINFPNWLDPDGWFFNPLAWQFLFILGFFGAKWASHYQGSFPKIKLLQFIAITYLIFSFFEAFPWQYWGFNDFRIISLPMPEKAYLSPLRLLDVIAIFYLVQSISFFKKISEGLLGRFLSLFGRHSLEVFSLSTIFDLWGRLMFASWGQQWFLQLGVNIIGVYCLYCLACYLDQLRRKQKAMLLKNTN